MANNIFYQYLEAAFRYRVYNPKGKTATPDTHFSSFGYNLTYKKVFEYARKILPAFYRNPAEFPDTEAGNLQLAKKVLEKLDKHQDIELENQFKGITVSEAQNQAITEAQTESQQSAEQAVPASTAINTPVGGIPFGVPSAPSSISSAPHRVFQTPPPVSGMEGGRGQGTAATAKTNQLATQPASVRTEAPAASSGNPSKAAGSYTPGPQGFNFSAFKSSVSSSFKKAQNFASPAGPFLKVNLGRLGRGMTGGIRAGLESANPFLGRMGTGLANNLSRIAQPGVGGMGGSRSFFGRLGGLGRRGGRNMLARGNGKSVVSSGAKKWALGLVGFLLIFGLAFFGGINGTTSTGETAPLPVTGGDISSCKFTRAKEPQLIRSNLLLSYIQEASQKSSIPPVVLAAFIRVESPSSSSMSDDQISNYSTNCAKSSTGALGIMQIQPPGTTSARGDPASCDDCIDAGAKLVGKTVSAMTTQDYCDPKTNITVGAGWILKKMSKLGYGDGTKWDPGWTNNKEAIKALVNTYYGCLDYGTTECTGPYNYADDVSTSIQNCQSASTTTPIDPGAVISCPVVNGKASTSSYAKNPNYGHCSPNYLSEGRCREDCPGGVSGSRRAKAIDVPTNGQDVTLPTVNGQSANWVLKLKYPIDLADGGGEGLMFEALTGSDIWTLDMLHMAGTSLAVCTGYPIGCTTYPSGAAIGKTAIDHVHFTLGKNLKDNMHPGPSSSVTDCDPGWISSDFMCQ